MQHSDGDAPGATGLPEKPQEPTLAQPFAAGSPLGKLVPLQPMPVHPALSASPNAWALLKALRRRWLPAVILGVLLGAGAAIAVWFVAPPSPHSARNLLYMAYKPPSIVKNIGDESPFDMFQRSQAALIKSRFVLSKALEQPGVAKLELLKDEPDPPQWLEKHLKVEFVSGSEIVRIGLDGKFPKDLETLVDAITKAYLEEIVDKERFKRLDRLEQLKQLYNKFDERIRAKKQSLEDLGRAAGAGNSENLIFKQQIALQLLASANS